MPLSRVADITFGSGPTAIQRYNQNRRVLVGADLAAGVLKGEAQAQIDALPVLQNLPLGGDPRCGGRGGMAGPS